VLLGEEKPRPVLLEDLRSNQSLDRAVSLGHVQAGRFVIFVSRQRILAEGDESGHDAFLRMLLVQFVSPNRIELIQLIVQCVAAIFCYQDRVFIIRERQIIERSMIGITQDHERNVSSVAAPVERIDALIKVHEQNAAGPTHVLFVNDDLYVMQRLGDGDQSGLIFVLNNRGTWNGTWVQTQWNNTGLIPAAWRGRDDLSTPQEKWTNESGWVDLWAPPRGYVVYIPG
jgi:Alpha-amylase C-terminal